MTRHALITGLFGAAAAALSFASAPAAAAPGTSTAQTWSASGTLLESCTCAVPCTCNFGEGPSPHPYCHAVFAYRLEKASWNGTDLSGLIVGGADGPKGIIGFLDERATPNQRPALEKLARAVMAQGGPAGGPRKFIASQITHAVEGNNLRLEIPGHGGFVATVIVGRDGRSPVVVENNTVWPIPRAIKGKAKPLPTATARRERFAATAPMRTTASFRCPAPSRLPLSRNQGKRRKRFRWRARERAFPAAAPWSKRRSRIQKETPPDHRE
jgi:hypothetical protein